MKRMLLMVVVLFAIATTACEKIDDLLTFYINEEETFTIESGFPLGALIPATPFTITTNSEETFKNNKTRAELVKDVSLNKLDLTITNPQGQNFDFLKRIELYISSEKQPELKIAYLEEVPAGASVLKLKSTNAKLDEYIKGDNYTIRTKAEIAKPITEDITIKADMRF
ncbi:MAG: hypothetical protein LPK03_08955 [Pontibacter sp.]|nr:hypothetical protein [Pontibacter sp.]